MTRQKKTLDPHSEEGSRLLLELLAWGLNTCEIILTDQLLFSTMKAAGRSMRTRQQPGIEGSGYTVELFPIRHRTTPHAEPFIGYTIAVFKRSTLQEGKTRQLAQFIQTQLHIQGYEFEIAHLPS